MAQGINASLQAEGERRGGMGSGKVRRSRIIGEEWRKLIETKKRKRERPGTAVVHRGLWPRKRQQGVRRGKKEQYGGKFRIPGPGSEGRSYPISFIRRSKRPGENRSSRPTIRKKPRIKKGAKSSRILRGSYKISLLSTPLNSGLHATREKTRLHNTLPESP